MSLKSVILLGVLTGGLTLASPLTECANNCNIWIWSPSTLDLTVTNWAPDEPGTWNGHSGIFEYLDFTTTLEPYWWLSVNDYTGSDPLGAPVVTGWKQFIDVRYVRNAVMFDWYDPGFEGDISHLHHDSVLSGTLTYSYEWHGTTMWQCADGTTPPDPPYPYPYNADSPEPGSLACVALGIMGIVLGIRVADTRQNG